VVESGTKGTAEGKSMIHLGYETGTARPVSIPLAHMAVTGQTQQSGKTTTLEALIDRGNLRAVVFITKPGEKSFQEKPGRRILPFFRERADWEYVKGLLEARRSESLSKWDGYLMRVCSGAHTLQDVRANVAQELPKKKSARPSHYEVLAGYLDLIIPELERVEYTDKLLLARGVNVMDLSIGKLSDDMQSMVIRSTIEQIHKHERNTVLVLPEAWKFIPEGGRSSVFQALHGLIREGATNGNFVWIDAQDLAVVSKRILKSVTVWILGKQQEANEVARTINHLIDPIQIRPDMIKSLGIGQFLICADSIPARRVYVQPRWLGELDAQAIARGEESVETAQAIFRQKKREVSMTRPRIGGINEKSEAPEPVRQPAVSPTAETETADRSIGAGIADGHDASGVDRSVDDGKETDIMWKERAEQAEAEIETLRGEIKNLQKLLNDYRDTGQFPPNGGPPADTLPRTGPITSLGKDAAAYDLNFIYDEIKHRAQSDPAVLLLLAQRPELRVEVEAQVLEADGKTLRGGVALLIHRGFFTGPKNGNQVYAELQRIGRKVAKRTVYDELERIAEWGFLTKETDGYQATDLKVTVKK
jgi:hypothetical protein